MKDFFKFDKMFAPTIIKVLFWIGLVFAVLYSLTFIVTGLAAGEFIVILVGILALVIGPLAVRLYSEMFIIMFKIHETLEDIKNK